MWKLLPLTLAAALLFGGPVQAGTLTSATWVGDFAGTPFTLVTSGASLTASGSATGSKLTRVSLTVPDLRLTRSGGGIADSLLSQTLGGSQTISSAYVANQGVSGASRFFLGGSSTTGTLILSVPLSVGVAGNVATTNLIPGANIPVEVTATYFPWTTGSQTFTGLTFFGAAAPNVTFSGTNSLSGGAGRITLVSPTRTRVCLGPILAGPVPCVAGTAGNTQSSISATATRLTLTFAVPEPGTVMLLAAGLVSLASARRCPWS